MSSADRIGPQDLLACSRCGGRVRPSPPSADLVCTVCGSPIVQRDGIFFAEREPDSRAARQTVEEFGRRWNRVYQDMGGLKSFLLPMIEPVQASFFKNKVIVDAGGGFGRLTKIMLDFGAAHVVLLDASDAVRAAADYLADYQDRVTIVRGDLLQPPLADGTYDLFFCHGVLHHTGNPRKAVLGMSRKVKPENGSMILWVYAQEGNGFLSKLVALAKRISGLVGDKGRWAMAHLIDAGLWLLTKAVYAPLAGIKGFKERLWYGEYFLDFLFDPGINNRMDRLQMYHDFLTTPIVEYYSRDQLQAWADEAGYRVCRFFFYRRQSWSLAAGYNKAEDFA